MGRGVGANRRPAPFDGSRTGQKAPKIIVEILSPATAKKDETVKFEIYEAEGVPYYIPTTSWSIPTI